MYNKIPVPLLRQYAVIVIVNLLAVCSGMDISWSSPGLVKLQDPLETPLSRPITDDEAGWIVSIGYIFSILTLPCAGFLMDYIGKRFTILAASMIKIVAGIIYIFSTEVWMLLVARVINGVATTSAFMFIMVYSTEISSKEIRGSLGIILTISSNLGVLFVLGIGPYITYLTLSIMMTVIPVCTTIPLLFIPDTPYSLYKKGNIEEAKKILTYFRGSEALAEEELIELSQSKPNQNFRIEMLNNKVYIKALFIVIVMGVGLQCVGFHFISFYLQTILDMSNTSVSPATGSIIIGVIQITTSIFASIFVDQFGRKPILVSTLLTMAVGQFGLGIFFVIKEHGLIINGFLNYLPLVCIAIVTCSYNGGIGCLYFVIVAELLDGPIRALGSAMSAIAFYATLSLLSRYTMTILSAMGADVTFSMFGILCILMSLFIIFLVPETKQKTIAEIQRVLGGSKEAKEKSDYVSRF